MKGRIPLKRNLRGLDFNPVRSVLLLAMLVALLLGCGLPGDPMLDDIYTRNVYPGTAGDYSVGSEDLPYSEGWFDEGNFEDIDVTGDSSLNDVGISGETTFSGTVVLEGDGKVWLELRPDLDFNTVQAHGKPTQVARGIVHGFSLPIYAADNEELFFETHVPHRWDEESDILIHIHCYLDTANTDKNFNLQLSWINFTDGDNIIPAGSNDLTVETPTGTAAQYQTFHIAYTVDYDIAPTDPILSSDELHLRVRRLAASADEIAGEVVITHLGMVFQRDKLGDPIP